MPYAVQGAALAPITTGVLSSSHLRRLVIILTAIALAIALVVTVAPEATEARAGLSQTERVLKYARSHVGARFRLGTEGMRYFDCSGLVYRVFQQAGVVKKIGGGRKLAKGYYRWFKERGLLSRSNPKPGDLIWWTKKGRIEHIGLYVGNGRAISALINPYGVRKHTVRGVHLRFLAFGHSRLDR